MTERQVLATTDPRKASATNQADTLCDKALPSGRKMAEIIGVSINTIVLVYESLVDEGYLIARKRNDLLVHPNSLTDPALI